MFFVCLQVAGVCSVLFIDESTHHCGQAGDVFHRILHLLLRHLDQHTTVVVLRRKRLSSVPRHPRVHLDTNMRRTMAYVMYYLIWWNTETLNGWNIETHATKVTSSQAMPETYYCYWEISIMSYVELNEHTKWSYDCISKDLKPTQISFPH